MLAPQACFPEPIRRPHSLLRGDTITVSLNGGSVLRNSFHDMEARTNYNLFGPSLVPSFFPSGFFVVAVVVPVVVVVVVAVVVVVPPFLPPPPFFWGGRFSLRSMHTHTRRFSRTRVHACTHTHSTSSAFHGVLAKCQRKELLGSGVGRRTHPTPPHPTHPTAHEPPCPVECFGLK